jgi:phosphatidylglycerophosphate synthase
MSALAASPYVGEHLGAHLGDLIYLCGFIAFFSVPLLVYVGLLWTGAVVLPAVKNKGGGSRLFGPVFIGYYYWMMGPIFRLAARSRVTPNQITAAALVVAALTAIAIATGHFALGSALLLGGGTLDLIDGQVARAKKMATRGGAFLDSTVDRICDGLIFGGCVVYYAGSPMMMIVSLVVLVMSFTVSYARSRAETLGVVGSGGLMQRADRITVLGIALAFSPFFAHRSEGFVGHPFYAITAGALCLLALLNTTTALARIVWTMGRLEGSNQVSPMNALRARDDLEQAIAAMPPANDTTGLLPQRVQRTLQADR